MGDTRMEQPPLRLAERSAAPSISLSAAVEAAPDELDDIARWNRQRREPARFGFARSLPEPLRVDLAAGAPDPSLRSGEAVAHAGGLLSRTAAGELVWGARVEVADAHRLRLHLTAATTNVEFTVTQADVVKGYFNPPGQAALPIQDTQAFATCP